MIKRLVRSWIGGLQKFLSFYSLPSISKVNVSEENVMAITAFWCGVAQISDGLLKYPLVVRRRVANGRDEDVPDHPLAALFRDGVAEWLDETSFVSMSQYHLLTHGNSYWRIRYNGAGRIEMLTPLLPDRTGPIVNYGTGDILYNVADATTGKTSSQLPSYEILHLKDVTRDGVYGLSPISVFRDNLGLTIAAERYGAKFFGNDATPSGILSTEQVLPKETMDEMLDRWVERNSGVNQRGPAILGGGLQYHPIGLPPGDSQFLATRVHGIQDVARILKCSPTKLYDMTRATYNNVAQENLSFENDTLHPRAIRMAAALNKQVMMRDDYYFAFEGVGGQWESLSQRAKAYQLATGNKKWMSPIEVRRREGMPDEIEGMEEEEEGISDDDASGMQSESEQGTERSVGELPTHSGRAIIADPNPDLTMLEKRFEKEVQAMLESFGAGVVEQISEAQLGNWRKQAQDAMASDVVDDSDLGAETVLSAYGLDALLLQIETAAASLSPDETLDEYADYLSTLLLDMHLLYSGGEYSEVNESFVDERAALLALNRGAEVGIQRGVVQDDEPQWAILVAAGVFSSPAMRATAINATEAAEMRNRAMINVLRNGGASEVMVRDCVNGCEPGDAVCIARANVKMGIEDARSQRLAHPNCTLHFEEIT